MKYVISTEYSCEGCRFVILPPNNRHQALGVSPWYDNVKESEEAKRDFLDLIYKNNINKIYNKYVKIECEIIEQKDKNNNIQLIPKYKFYYYNDNDKLVFFRTKGFFQKNNCKKCLTSIYNAVVENY